MNAIVEIRKDLAQMEPQFKMVLPEHVTTERFMRIVQTSLQMNPDLLKADRASLFGACMKAAQDGLLPDGREGAFVTFWDKKANANRVQWMPMVNGILKKVRNSGELLSISANLVYKKDKFEYYIDDQGEHLSHRPELLDDERGEPIAVYAIARTKSGGLYIEIMSRQQVEQVRNASRAKDSGPWVSWWGEMAKKTCIRRLSKKLPMSTDLEGVIQRDDDLYEFDQAPRQAASGNDAVRAALGIEAVVPQDAATRAATYEATYAATEAVAPRDHISDVVEWGTPPPNAVSEDGEILE